MRYLFLTSLTFLILSVPCFAQAATEFESIVDPDNGEGADYTSLATWEASVQTELAATTTRVFSGTATGSISQGDTVTINSSTVHDGVEANVVATTTAGQILVENATSSEEVVLDDGDTLEKDASNYWTVEGTGNELGDSAIAVATCRSTGGSADTTTVTIDGWTTDSDNYIKVWTDPDERYRHDGKWDDNKYRLASSEAKINVYESYTKIKYLQVYNSSGAPHSWPIYLRQGHEVEVSNCFLKKGSSSNTTAVIYVRYQSNNRVINNIGLSDGGLTHDWGRLFRSVGGSGNEFYNNTAITINGTSTAGFQNRENDNNIYKNNISIGNDKDFHSTETLTSEPSHNISSDETAFGSNSLTNQEPEDIFVDHQNGDYRLKSDSPATDAGTDLSSDFTDDIRGLPRNRHEYWNWDIGAFRATKEVVAIVDTDTSSSEAHYHSLNDAIVGESGDSSIAVATSSLVTADEQLTVELRASSGEADTTPVEVDGFVTGEDNFVKMTTHPDHRHEGRWDEEKYRLDSDSIKEIVLSVANIVIDGLQLKDVGSGGTSYAIMDSGDVIKQVTIKNCLIVVDVSTGHARVIRLDSGETPHFLIYNNILLNGTGNDGDWGTHGIFVDNYTSAKIYNNTVLDIKNGIYDNSGDAEVKNNISINSSNDFNGSFGSNCSNNLSSDSTAPGENSIHNVDPEDLFMDPDSLDLKVNPYSPAIDAGVDLSQYFTTDIESITRPQEDAWDIGAHEFVFPPDFRMRGQIQLEGDVRFE